MNDRSPQLSVWSCIIGGGWLLLSIVGTVVVPKFREMFEEMSVGTKLPILTGVIVGLPGAGWIALGLVGAAGIIGKSLILPPDHSALIDKIAFVVLALMVGAIVVGLFLPLIDLMDSLSRGSSALSK